VPHAASSSDLHTTLTEFVARFPDKHRSDIAKQMKIYKSNRKSRTGDCNLSSDDEEASCSAKQLLDYLCHDIHSALRVKDKAAREVTTAEALRLSSANLEKKAAPSEMDKLIKQIASLKAQLQAPPASVPAGTPVRALAVAPEHPAPPRPTAKPQPNSKANYSRDFVLTPAMRNCSNCNERHLDRDCPNRPPPEPLRAPATAAGAGTADPPKVRAPRPVAVAPRATAPDLPAAAAAQPPPAPVPAVNKPAQALTTRRFATAHAPAPALSALRYGIEPTENGWTSPHEMGGTDDASDHWVPRARDHRPALSARRASTTISGPTYSMFADRNLAPHVAPATPASPVCTIGGQLASLCMRLLCLVSPTARSATPSAAASSLAATAHAAATATARPTTTGAAAAHAAADADANAAAAVTARPATPSAAAPPAAAAADAHAAATAAARPATPGAAAAPAATAAALPFTPPSASPSPARSCSAPPSPPPSPPSPRRLYAPKSSLPSPTRRPPAPPSPPPSPPSPRRLCAIQSCNEPAYIDERPGALAICCSRRHQLLNTALQQPPVCAVAECTRPVHIDELAAVIHEYCGITHARLAAARGESWFLPDRPDAATGAEAQPATDPLDMPPAPLRCALPSCGRLAYVDNRPGYTAT